MSDTGTNTGDAATTEPTTVSADDFKKVTERAQRFEGMLTTREKEFGEFKKKFEGIDLEEVKALKARAEEAERKAAENDPEKLAALIERKWKQKLDATEAEKNQAFEKAKTLEARVKTLAVTEKVMGEVGKLFNDDLSEFIKGVVERQCDLDDEGNIIVKNDKGEQLYFNGRPMTVKEFGDSLIEKYPSAAKATGVGGTRGTTPGQKTNGGHFTVPQTLAELNALPNPRAVWDKLSQEDKLRLGSTPIGAMSGRN